MLGQYKYSSNLGYDPNKQAFRLLLHNAFLSVNEMNIFENKIIPLLNTATGCIYKELDETTLTKSKNKEFKPLSQH